MAFSDLQIPHMSPSPSLRSFVFILIRLPSGFSRCPVHFLSFSGWCWPGTSIYLDFLNPTTRQYWINQFAFNIYDGSTPALYTWNDMNEVWMARKLKASFEKGMFGKEYGQPERNE